VVEVLDVRDERRSASETGLSFSAGNVNVGAFSPTRGAPVEGGTWRNS